MSLILQRENLASQDLEGFPGITREGVQGLGCACRSLTQSLSLSLPSSCSQAPEKEKLESETHVKILHPFKS